ncbi:MAG: ribonuclease III [Cyanobacteria bacterium J06626_6]
MSKTQVASHHSDLTPLLGQLGIDAEKVNQALLQLAFVDISSSADENNEKLEFLGDAALRLAAAEFLMEAYPQMALGEMAAVRSHIVSDRILATIAQKYSLSRYLVLSKSAAGDKAGKNSRLADTVEAVLGVLYLSTGNLSLIRPWLDPHFQQLTQALRADPARQNYKAALQELTQSHYKALPTYKVAEISQLHGDEERFHAVVWFQDKPWGEGKGRSRKMAQQAAAKVAFAELQQAINPQASERAS